MVNNVNRQRDFRLNPPPPDNGDATLDYTEIMQRVETIGTRVLFARRQAGMNQAELAQMLESILSGSSMVVHVPS